MLISAIAFGFQGNGNFVQTFSRIGGTLNRERPSLDEAAEMVPCLKGYGEI